MQVENILFDFNQIICYNIIGGDIFNTAKAYVKFFYFLFCQLDKNFFLILLDKAAHMGSLFGILGAHMRPLEVAKKFHMGSFLRKNRPVRPVAAGQTFAL